MTLQQSHRDPRWTALVDRSFAEGRPATMSDRRGNTVVAVSRHREPGGARTVVTVDGDIDVDTAPLVLAALMLELRAGDVCCDLSRVPFLGAAGAHTLFTAHRYATERGHTFSYRGARGFTARVLAVVDPDQVIARQRAS